MNPLRRAATNVAAMTSVRQAGTMPLGTRMSLRAAKRKEKDVTPNEDDGPSLAVRDERLSGGRGDQRNAVIPLSLVDASAPHWRVLKLASNGVVSRPVTIHEVVESSVEPTA